MMPTFSYRSGEMEERSVHSCSRCGINFYPEHDQRICVNCRRPPGFKKALSTKLSFRENQVVNLVAQAKGNKEIAFLLHLAEGTVKEYMNRIFKKTGIGSRTELAVYAVTHPQGTL
jgi:DNA-binding NarL/FixJ family response regulator